MANRVREYEGNALNLKKKREKAWRDANRLNGLCSCGRSVAVQGKKRCAICITAANKKRQERRALRKQSNLCTECSKPTNGKNLCSSCQTNHKFIVNCTKQRRVEEGMCIRCGKDNQLDTKYCLVCTLKCLAYGIWKDRAKWEELLNLFNQQNGTCPYLKEKLIIGLNASLDHKIPKKLGGSDNIANLQWVHKIVNTMKWDLSEEEFYFYIRKIYANRDKI